LPSEGLSFRAPLAETPPSGGSVGPEGSQSSHPHLPGWRIEFGDILGALSLFVILFAALVFSGGLQ
jgi:hypothetical protein